VAAAQFVSNAACPDEVAFYNPGNGEDIVVPDGYKVEVFAKDLNFPTAVAFLGTKSGFRVLVLESGHGLPSRCNDNENPVWGGKFSKTNPFTPDILVFDNRGRLLDGAIGKPKSNGEGFQPDGPAIGLAFESGVLGGRLFGTDSNAAIRTAGAANNTSRIVTVDLIGKKINPFITGLPTGDHPAEQIAFKGGFIYWSQGSTTNSGVVGRDNGGGNNQQDIPCQDITLSNNVFDSGGGVKTSGYSPFGVKRPGATVRAFASATGPGICDGAILRAQLGASDPKSTIEPFSWGYRNPFGIRFPPDNHVLAGCLFVTENGEDERGARPTNNSPDRLHCARQNWDGTPDYHGWPDRFGFLASTQAVFNPVGGPGDDNPAAVVGKPVQSVLAFPPQPPVAPLAIEPADVAAVGLDFAPDSFVHGVVKPGAALVSREGDFGFSRANGKPEAGHDIELVNFNRPGDPLKLELSRFAFNCAQPDQFHTVDGGPVCVGESEQAFVAQLRGINRPVDAKFGPDGALYLVDYGAVRDFGQSDPGSKFVNPLDAPLVQIPGTGVIWKISGK
jgi:glucose/arabinose dehydrogenase